MSDSTNKIRDDKQLVLITLSTSAWGAKRSDKGGARLIEEARGAKEGTNTAGKWLINKTRWDRFHSVRCALRDEHTKATLPWQDRGARCIDPAGLPAYIEKIKGPGGLVEQYEQAVRENFGSPEAFDAMLEEAKQMHGPNFRRSDYPANWKAMLSHFDVTVDIDVSVREVDFRGLVGEEAGELANQLASRRNESMNKRLAGAVLAGWDRLIALLDKNPNPKGGDGLSVKLDAFNPYAKLGQGKKPFRDSAVGNIVEFARLAPGLSVSGDTDLSDTVLGFLQHLRLTEDSSDEAVKAVCKRLRTDDLFRLTASQKAKDTANAARRKKAEIKEEMESKAPAPSNQAVANNQHSDATSDDGDLDAALDAIGNLKF